MKKYIIFWVFLCVAAGAAAQDEIIIPDPPPLTEAPLTADLRQENNAAPSVEYRKIEEEKWEKASGGMDYSADVLQPLPERRNDTPRSTMPNFNWDASKWEGILKVFAILVLVILVGWAAFQMLQSPSNTLVVASDGTPVTLENLDAYIQETDLERFLREALAAGNYSQAVRIYYLQVIKDLSLKGYIDWKREKTNRDYLREIRNSALAPDFRSATRTFEEVWYGNSAVNESSYQMVSAQMENLISRIKTER